MAVTLNRNVFVLNEKLIRFNHELIKSQSKGAQPLREADRDRLLSYIEDSIQYINYVAQQPQTDEPESHPFELTATDNPDIIPMDNTNLLEAHLMINVITTEVIDSQSSRWGSGWHPADMGRFLNLFRKLENLIIDYIDKAPLLDLPESTPWADHAKPGNKGIQPGK